MKAYVESPNHLSETPSSGNGSDDTRKLVLEELEKILASQSFRSAARSKQFLRYVVEHQLGGHSELLKERCIGTEVFQRPPGYATGEDPVVRVQAGEVRRRLDQYYQVAPNERQVRIELPIGSYSPIFHFSSQSSEAVSTPAGKERPILAKIRNRQWRWVIAGTCAVAAIATVTAVIQVHRNAQPKTVFDQFWEPVFSTQQPALICLAKGLTYRPSKAFYDRYTQTHPGMYQTEVERFSVPPQVNPNERILWSDMEYQEGYGVALGDVSAAVKFSTVLGQLGKTNQVRIGSNYSFEDLRNSPAIVIGAFNNRWTMDMLSKRRFAFVIDNGGYAIREQVQGGRAWFSIYGKTQKLEQDYGIVARLLDSESGQFTVAAAGLRDSGTQAAGELASNANLLAAALRDAPAGWQKKNLEVVLRTTITDSVPGPPQVVATYYW